MSQDIAEKQDNNNKTGLPSSLKSTKPKEAPLQPVDNVSCKIISHFKDNKTDASLWVIRLLLIFFTICYIVPIFNNQQSAFTKVLLANAASSVIRLHQRLESFESLANLLAEDSCHYLIYSLIFFNVQPTLLILIPVALLGILHASSYSVKMLDLIDESKCCQARAFMSLVELQSVYILHAVAFSEIFIMPITVIFTFMGKASLMTPIIYYHFLVMRYSSRRNPYTRNAFTELRMATEKLASKSPPTVAKILFDGMAFINCLAPQSRPVTSTE